MPLLAALAEDDMDTAIDNCSIDSFYKLDSHIVRKIRALNETGDADAYWAIED